MTADSQAELTALQQALALAQRLGSATTYADLIELAVGAFDDGELQGVVLFGYEHALDGAASQALVLAGWRRGLDQHPALGRRFELDMVPLAESSPGALQVVEDVERDERVGPASRAALRQYGSAAYLSLPLLLHGTLVGTIGASWAVPRAFTPATIQLAETIIALAPSVTERIQLYEEARGRLEELQALRDSLEAQVSEQTTDLRTFQAIVDGALDAMAIATPAGVLVYGNPAFATMSGFGDTVVGTAFPDYFAPEDLAVATGEMLPALTKEGAWKGVLRMRRPDGASWVAELNAFALRGPDGRAETLAGIFRDISGERQRTEELARANERLEQSFRTSPLATLEADDRGIIRRWNPAAERIFGWPAEEAIGRNAIELLVPGLAREHVEGVVGALLSGAATNSRNVNVRKDGRLITCEWHNAVLRDSDGTVLGWLSQTQDITEQLRAEEELRESQRRLTGVLRNLPGMAYRRSEPAGLVEYISEGAVLVTGYPAADFRPADGRPPRRDYADLILPEELPEVGRYSRAALAERRPFELAYLIRHADGGERVVWDRGTGVYDDDGALVAVEGFITDITEPRRAEAERRQLQEQVIEAQRAALRELSTPIIPIGEGVVAMPLIGSLDSARARQVVETLLEGVATTRASVAILDITGVPIVDTQVANALLQAAQAVKLLGARVLLTGIRPEVAQTLVGLGLDLSGITTLATLESGIRYALGFGAAGRR